MKKILFGLLALSSLVVAKEVVSTPAVSAEPTSVYTSKTQATPNNYFSVRFGGDMLSRYKQASVDLPTEEYLDDWGYSGKLNEKKASGFGWELALEGMREVWADQGLELGLGLAYQRHSKTKGYDNSGEFLGDQEFWTQETKSFDSIPLYVVAKYKFENLDILPSGWRPYVKADLGYSFNRERGNSSLLETYYNIEDGPDDTIVNDELKVNAKIKNGIYWGVGVGVENNDWTLDLMYKINSAKIKGDIYDIDDPGFLEGTFNDRIDYSRVTLSFGYKFNY